MSSGIDPSKLGDLYPKAKTYDELQQDRDEITALKKRREPKFVTVQASILLSLLILLALLTIYLLPMIFGLHIMVGAFAAMGILILLVWLAKWAITHTLDIYTAKGLNAKPFLVLYSILLGCGIVAVYAMSGWSTFQSITNILVLATLHLGITLCLAWLTRPVGRL